MLVVAAPQFCRRFNIEFISAALPPDHYAVIALRGFHRYITRPHVGEHALRIALNRIPETSAAADLDEKAIAFIHRYNSRRFPRGHELDTAIFAHDGKPVGHCSLATMQAPRRT